MSSTISRRGVIAALGAGAAVNVPIITAKALPDATPAGHSDQALLDLGLRYSAALDAEDAASETWTTTCEEYNAARPEPPAAMRHRILDHFDHQFPAPAGTTWISDGKRSNIYNEAEVDYLRAMPIRTVDGRARAAEIIAACEGDRAACLSLAAHLGCGDAEAAYCAAVDARHAIGDAIVAAQRRSTGSLCGLGSSLASSAANTATTSS